MEQIKLIDMFKILLRLLIFNNILFFILFAQNKCCVILYEPIGMDRSNKYRGVNSLTEYIYVLFRCFLKECSEIKFVGETSRLFFF